MIPQLGLVALMTNRILIVGAGICGLAVAAELSRKMPTTLIDRLPVIGGITSGYENSVAVELAAQCSANGVDFLLGTAGLRWMDNKLLIAGPATGLRWLDGSHLVYAGGTRPSTAAELRLLGARLAGVYPAMVAYHLTESGVKLGLRPVIIGSGRWAKRVCLALAKRRCRATVISSDPSMETDFATTTWLGWLPVALHGYGRVAALQAEREGIVQTINCDAVVLAGMLRPMRNIDGAVFDNAQENNVSFVQMLSETANETDRARFGRAAASAVITRIKGITNES
jgi:NADPH-dependent 2,4-dienoyl-CoA reductase/sulfur reductase-like enzyme